MTIGTARRVHEDLVENRPRLRPALSVGVGKGGTRNTTKSAKNAVPCEFASDFANAK